MEETVIVIMIKEKQTGFLEKELSSCVVKNHDELLLNVFAEDRDGVLYTVLRLTCDRDVSDPEFDAIFDHYDEGVYEGLGVSFEEVEDCYNPTWELSLEYDEALLEDKINRLLEVHAKELSDVYETIADKSAGN